MEDFFQSLFIVSTWFEHTVACEEGYLVRDYEYSFSEVLQAFLCIVNYFYVKEHGIDEGIC